MAKYREIAGWILEQIDKGVYKSGDKILSENELCDMFDISRQTARHAIGMLIDRNVLRSAKGSGTFVAGGIGAGASKRIAVVTTYVDSYIFPKTIQGIEKKLTEYGYTMQLSFTNNTFVKERSILEDILKESDMAGIIIEPTRSALPNPNLDLYKKISDKGIQVLFINSFYKELNMPHVSLSDAACAYRAVKSLIDAGHKKIGCLLKLDDGQGHERYAGYLKAMMEAKIDVEDAKVVWLDTDNLEHMSDISSSIRRRFADCTALFAYNDQVAAKVIDILEKEGIDVKKDISIVSMDDAEGAFLNGFELDSVPHPKDRLGEKAAENLVHLIHNGSYDATYEFVEDVIKRGSVKKI